MGWPCRWRSCSLLALDVLAADAANPTIMAIADGLATVIELAGFPLLLIPLLRCFYGRAERALGMVRHRWL